MTINKLIYINS